ncbi:SDR family NAD(P)-dependent oxidoreductase [Mucilaginibacter sp. X4EP1]|uniref:SDR family NAD(P)-dependent oxidoreductase n=1 Tax=Mucilaginibacter sp. X4EP1 TaxID=2723092 RepID=UPI00216AA91C|nr:SDR family NAD(P)-dependent oxidoreductase [Mucilaginibacter sp. X4EP1]MCS3812015.1 NAD(P)-dependent dehydrogenase (short-subunit alcohol dehydrogenase family) [Mucilaginibacter sp. X4EP1]
MSTKSKKTAAVTGAGSGLGLEIVLGLAARGYQVFGTAFSAKEIAEFEKVSAGAGVILTVCDITKADDVKKWGDTVRSSLKGNGLDLLINNAGVLTPGPMEVLELDAIRREFEVNVFGSIAVINEFLPSLRKSKGRIVQIGSMTGRFPLPFSGPSSASKATMEAFADVYRTELKPSGVDFVMAQPGNMVTGGPAKTAAQLKQISENMSAEQSKLYGKYFDQFAISLNNMQSGGLSAKDAASRVIDISEQVPAPTRAAVGKDAEEILQMVREKSDDELDDLREQLFGFDKIV